MTPGTVERAGPACVLALRRTPTVDVVLGAREQAVLAEFHAWPLRAAEWRAGRHAAKELLRLAFGLEPGRVELVPAESGAPVLLVDGTAHPTLRVSLSHTDHWVAAAAADVAVGIDVADDEDGARLPNIARRVFSEGEAEACGAMDSIPNQAAVWALKEAGLKVDIGGVFSPGAKSIRVLSLNPARLANPSLDVALFRLPDAALAVSWKR